MSFHTALHSENPDPGCLISPDRRAAQFPVFPLGVAHDHEQDRGGNRCINLVHPAGTGILSLWVTTRPATVTRSRDLRNELLDHDDRRRTP